MVAVDRTVSVMISAALESKGLKDTMDTDKKKDSSAEETTVVPLPAVDTAGEHQRVRSSNDRDQERERDGRVAPHNQGYDEVADLTPVPTSEPKDEKTNRTHG